MNLILSSTLLYNLTTCETYGDGYCAGSVTNFRPVKLIDLARWCQIGEKSSIITFLLRLNWFLLRRYGWCRSRATCQTVKEDFHELQWPGLLH